MGILMPNKFFPVGGSLFSGSNSILIILGACLNDLQTREGFNFVKMILKKL